eukprot:9927433-Lingulodinium_polyedra.AAC.1
MARKVQWPSRHSTCSPVRWRRLSAQQSARCTSQYLLAVGLKPPSSLQNSMPRLSAVALAGVGSWHFSPSLFRQATVSFTAL